MRLEGSQQLKRRRGGRERETEGEAGITGGGNVGGEAEDTVWAGREESKREREKKEIKRDSKRNVYCLPVLSHD